MQNSHTHTTSDEQTVTIPPVEIPTLHLVPTKDKKKKKRQQKVKWDDKVVDNEHMNKKKTKICCIFHPQDESDYECESSDSDSSSSSSSSDSDSDGEAKDSKPNAYERQPKYTKKTRS